MINRLFHCAIRTAQPQRMKNFYTRVAGMMVDTRRPRVPVKGFWLRPAAPGGDAIIHVFSDEDALTPDGRVPTGGGAVHHLSFLTSGYHDTRARIEKAGLSFRSSILRDAGLWQLFVHDPHGILVELTFEAAVETGPEPLIGPDLEFDAQKITWFDPSQYTVFDH
jgi:catechol 2,3-dioxygenase-like lactoylglutathione lyase family enzyme